MAARPRLKSIAVQQAGAQLVLWPRALRRVFVDDPTGSLAALLTVLAEGKHEVDALPGAMRGRGFEVTPAEVDGVLATLDELGVLEVADAEERLDAAKVARHLSNLRYYDLFATRARTSADMLDAIARARVLLLGVGGLGSSILQSLVGLGVGSVTIVDDDTVETKNLARQFAYGLVAVGRPKVHAAADWVAAYSGGTQVTPIRRRLTDPAAIAEAGVGCDIVVCAADTPSDIHLIVNEACFALDVPYVSGGLTYSTLSYWSVWPGRSACRLCLDLHRRDEEPGLPPATRERPLVDPPPVNRATGPVVQLISGLMSMEVMRYLTRSDPPIAQGAYHLIELADGLEMARTPWARHPDCPLCRGAGWVGDPA
jgi:molybdopterin-synthase adenylyltransferase